MRKIWNDPVCSKVIAGIILTLLGAIYSVIFMAGEDKLIGIPTTLKNKLTPSQLETDNVKVAIFAQQGILKEEHSNQEKHEAVQNTTLKPVNNHSSDIHNNQNINNNENPNEMDLCKSQNPLLYCLWK